MSSWPSIAELAQQVKDGKVTASELVEKSLKIIDEKKDFNAVIAVVDERARQRAKEIDEDVKNKKPLGKLAGVPFIAKDNLLTLDQKRLQQAIY